MKCPHCLTAYNSNVRETYIGNSVEEGDWNCFFEACPECKKGIVKLENQVMQESWMVHPDALGRDPLPAEVDDVHVVNDYTEAALVLSKSSKASAALSRRCLQYILREKVGIKRANLDQEIQALLDSNSLPSDIATNLDGIRAVGNFAAHPIKSTSTGEIVDVEPHEAEWNLDVLEQLLDFYYVRPELARKKKKELNLKLVAAGKPELK